MITPRCRKAVIAKDGETIAFIHEGREWMAWPSVDKQKPLWGVRLSPRGTCGYGRTIQEAVENAEARTPQAEAEARP